MVSPLVVQVAWREDHDIQESAVGSWEACRAVGEAAMTVVLMVEVYWAEAETVEAAQAASRVVAREVARRVVAVKAADTMAKVVDTWEVAMTDLEVAEGVSTRPE